MHIHAFSIGVSPDHLTGTGGMKKRKKGKPGEERKGIKWRGLTQGLQPLSD